jgi:hypothetical protein
VRVSISVFFVLFVSAVCAPVFADDESGLTEYSEEELQVALANDGIDTDELKESFLAGLQEPPKRSAAVLPPPASGHLPLAALVAQEKLKRSSNQAHIAHQDVVHIGPEVEGLVHVADPSEESFSALKGFFEKHLKGKKPETALMVFFFIMRLSVWLYQQEMNVKKSSLTYAERKACISPMNSRFLSYSEYAVRVTIVATRMWTDYEAVRETLFSQEWLRDPQAVIEMMLVRIQRIKAMMTEKLYLSSKISLMYQFALSVGLPFLWESVRRGGGAWHHESVQKALKKSVFSAGNLAGATVQSMYMNMLTPEQRSEVFHSTGGIVREEFIHRLTSWATEAAVSRCERQTDSKEKPPSLSEKCMRYAAMRLYTHAVAQMGALFLRSGLGSIVGKGLHLFGEGIRLVSGSKKNLFDTVWGSAVSRFKDPAFLPHVALFFPNALVLAVQDVVKTNTCGKRHDALVKNLSRLKGKSLFSMLQMMQENPLQMGMIQSSIASLQKLLTKHEWDAVAHRFMIEIFIDQFLDGQRLACQYITEPLILFFSRPLVKDAF